MGLLAMPLADHVEFQVTLSLSEDRFREIDNSILILLQLIIDPATV